VDTIEISPKEYSKYQIREDLYDKIKVKQLTRRKLEGLYKKAKAKEIPRIVETSDYFIIQYKKKPVVLINRKTGRFEVFTSELEKYGERYVKQQASIAFRILKKYQLLVNPWRKTVWSRSRKIPFIEEGETT